MHATIQPSPPSLPPRKRFHANTDVSYTNETMPPTSEPFKARCTKQPEPLYAAIDESCETLLAVQRQRCPTPDTSLCAQHYKQARKMRVIYAQAKSVDMEVEMLSQESALSTNSNDPIYAAIDRSSSKRPLYAVPDKTRVDDQEASACVDHAPQLPPRLNRIERARRIRKIDHQRRRRGCQSHVFHWSIVDNSEDAAVVPPYDNFVPWSLSKGMYAQSQSPGFIILPGTDDEEFMSQNSDEDDDETTQDEKFCRCISIDTHKATPNDSDSHDDDDDDDEDNVSGCENHDEDALPFHHVNHFWIQQLKNRTNNSPFPLVSIPIIGRGDHLIFPVDDQCNSSAKSPINNIPRNANSKLNSKSKLKRPEWHDNWKSNVATHNDTPITRKHKGVLKYFKK